MIRSLKSMLGYALKAEDGDIGIVIDYFFDDPGWKVRYIQGDTGKWLPGKKVLISPGATGMPDWEFRKVPVKMTRDKIQKSPEIRVDDPLSRPKEEMICKYYEWPEYWCNSNVKLRSLDQIIGYGIHARDGKVGVIDDIVIDDATWDIRYFIVDLGGFIFGKKVLLSPQWVDEIVEEGREMRLDVLKDKVTSSPDYNPKEPINRELEEVIYDYMGKPRYWKDISNPDKNVRTGESLKLPKQNGYKPLVASIILLLLISGGVVLMTWSPPSPVGMATKEPANTPGVPPQHETTLAIVPVTPIEAPTTTQTMRAPTTTQAMPANAPNRGTFTLQIRNDPNFGNILVDNKGMTLYYRRTDHPMNTECYGTCAANWPPMILNDDVQLQPGIGGKIAGLQRGGGGGRQVTYNGQPLYYYIGDKLPGEARGYGLAGNWYVVRIRPSEAAQTPPTETNNTATPSIAAQQRASLMACQSDYDCIRVKSDCCGCESGGEAIALNRAYDGPWNEELSRRCGTAFCVQASKTHPSCSAKPICDSGECTLEYTPKPTVAAESTSECSVNSDCGTTSEETVCYQGDVYKMTNKPICLHPEGKCVIRLTLADSAIDKCSQYNQACRKGKCAFEDY